MNGRARRPNRTVDDHLSPAADHSTVDVNHSADPYVDLDNLASTDNRQLAALAAKPAGPCARTTAGRSGRGGRPLAGFGHALGDISELEVDVL
jgi:hypothetical protein